MIRYITSSGENPLKRPARLKGALISNGASTVPPGVVILSERGPAPACGSITTSTKRYVPAALTRVSPACKPAPTACTRAPPRLRPRISTRTGLIECPAHQFGGSTFSTAGALCAAQMLTATSRRMRHIATLVKHRSVFSLLLRLNESNASLKNNAAIFLNDTVCLPSGEAGTSLKGMNEIAGGNAPGQASPIVRRPCKGR